MENTLVKLLEKFPNKDWEWYHLSKNPNITFQYVLENSDKDWDWDGLSCNPNITFQYVLNHPNEHWNWQNLSSNKGSIGLMVSRGLKECGIKK